MNRFAAATVLILTILGCGAFQPDTLPRNLRALYSARSLKCTFGPGSGGVWQGGKVTVQTSSYDMTTHFDAIDLKAGTARVIGNSGSSDVLVRATGDAGIYFLEETRMGGLAVTFVYPLLNKDRDFVAVMSRHMEILDRPIPSQGYGSCKIWQ